MVTTGLKRGVIDVAVNPRPSLTAVSSNSYNHWCVCYKTAWLVLAQMKQV